MSDKEYDYSEYQEQPTSDDALAELSRLAFRMNQEAQEVERLEASLKKAKENFRAISEEAIPNMMDSLGIREFTTKEGFKIKIKESVHASIKAENSQAALAWIEANGYGRMIKNQFTVNYATDQSVEASALRSFLEEHNTNFKQKESVHPMTLKAWAKELLEEGREIPLDLISVYRKREAKAG